MIEGRCKANGPASNVKAMEVKVAGLGASVPKVGRAAPFRTIWHGVHSRLLVNPDAECWSPLEVAVARAGTASSSWRCTAATQRRLTCARSTNHAAQVQTALKLILPRTTMILPETVTQPPANLRGAVEAADAQFLLCRSLAIVRRHYFANRRSRRPIFSTKLGK